MTNISLLNCRVLWLRAKKCGDLRPTEEMKDVSAFGALAGYLFGKNQANTAMKMTTQVISLVKAKKWPL